MYKENSPINKRRFGFSTKVLFSAESVILGLVVVESNGWSVEIGLCWLDGSRVERGVVEYTASVERGVVEYTASAERGVVEYTASVEVNEFV